MPAHRLTPAIISAAIAGFEQQKLQLDTQIAELRAMLPGGRTESTVAPEPTKGKRRKMSAAARKRIGDAQRKRWAASKGDSASASESTTKPKRKLSAAGRAAIVAALKKRWAGKRAAKKAPVKTSAKKAPTKKAPVKMTAKKAAKPHGATGTAAAQ
jgi:DNA-binding protein HU-beta